MVLSLSSASFAWMVRGNGGMSGAMCWLAGAVRTLQKEVYELKGTRGAHGQSYLGKILDELAEKHITQEQLKHAHAGDLERDRFEAAQMRDNASSEYHVVSRVGWAAGVEHGF